MKKNGIYKTGGLANGNNIPRHRNPPPCPQQQIDKIKIKEMEKEKLTTKKFNCINPIMIEFNHSVFKVEASEIQFKDKYFIFINDGEIKAIVPDSFLIIEVKE